MNVKKHKYGLLFGGGLDSVAYLILLCQYPDIKKNLSVIFVDYGQRVRYLESKAALYWANKYGVSFNLIHDTTISKLQSEDIALFTGNVEHSAFVQGRNLCLALNGLTVAQKLIFGFCWPGYEPFPDANEAFIHQLNDILNLSFDFQKYTPVTTAPYLFIHRSNLLSKAYSLDNELFDKCFTCWLGNKDLSGPCGICKHCLLLEEQKQQVLTEEKRQKGGNLHTHMEIDDINLEDELRG